MADQVTEQELPQIPADAAAPPNRYVLEFAHGVLHSKCSAEEHCILLAKTIQLSDTGSVLNLRSYLPSVFSRIREVSGVVEQEFDEEWNPLIVAQNFASKGSGKSGALFVVSKTKKYLLKTLRKEEKDSLKKMAPDLAEHFEKYPGSLLSRQYMLGRIETNGAKRYFVVFNNLFSSPDLVPATKFDLKGARINRKSSATELSDPSRVRMDLDETRTFPIGEAIREEVLEQIRHDSDLLAKHNIMDYSMLVGVVSLAMEDTEEKPKSKKNRRRKESKPAVEEEGHNARRKTPEFSEVWKTGLPSAAVANEWYLFGIIDILQDYNSFKKAAHALKVVAYRTSSGLSTVNAKYYSARFKDYMEHHVLVGPP